ncbi:MAG: mechanosensitive ion channel domain-containing protein, partial [Bacteroidota bacterium]
MQEVEKYSSQAIDLIWDKGPALVGAILTLIIGLWVIGLITKAIRKGFDKRGVDPSLAPFLVSLINAILKIMLVISVIGMIGIEMTSFVAILGAAGLAVGLALQGTLQNFAGGVIILILKPFKVGDFIDAAGYTGTVNEIQIFNTILKTPDNKTIIIPNGALANSSMTNFSTEELRRVDFTFGIGYGDDVDKAKSAIQKLIDNDDRILKDPAPFVAVSALADSSVNFVVRVWAQSSDYWGIHFDMNENVYKTFGEEGLNIPFPQMDIHLHKE